MDILQKRRAILLRGLDVAHARGAEIGPLTRPLVRKSDGEVFYVDHASSDTLREKYRGDRNVDVAEIVEIDAVWGERTLKACIGHSDLDYVLASHVAEHVPDLVAWLQEITEVLKEGGQLRLILPDKRVSADYLRDETRIPELLDAYLHHARQPRTLQILDCALDVADIDTWAAYRGTLDPGAVVRTHTCDSAMHIARDALRTGKYVDVHCWVFTPRSFAGLMEKLASYGLIDLACAEFIEPEIGIFEFYVFLERCGDRARAVQSWRTMRENALEHLPGSGAEQRAREQPSRVRIAELEAALDSMQRRVAALEGSTSWRLTTPVRWISERVWRR